MQDTPLETHEKSIKEMKNCLKNWMEPRECLRRVQNELQTVLDLPGWRRPASGQFSPAGGSQGSLSPSHFWGLSSLSLHKGTGRHEAKAPEIQGLCCAGGAGWDGPLVTLGTAWDQDPIG